MSKKLSLNKDTWNKLAKEWAVGIPPWRPTKKEIEIYKDFLEKVIHRTKTKPKALLMGATPELRDLMARYNINITLVDINPNMVRAMTELLGYSSGKEKVVIADWLKMPFPANSFDVVMCDHGLQHIFFEKWGIFFKEVKRVLKPRAYFINAVFSPEENEGLTVNDVIRIYRSNIVTREDKYYLMNRVIVNIPDMDNKKYYKKTALVNE